MPGVKRVHVASGIRMDLAALADEYLDELARHHVGGHLKVAPEHVSDRVLAAMKKPRAARRSRRSRTKFRAASAARGQGAVPRPLLHREPSRAPRVDEMIELAVFLKQHGYRPRQVQDFIPAPMDIATCMYHTGLDPHDDAARRRRARGSATASRSAR